MRKTKWNILFFFIVTPFGIIVSQDLIDIGASHIQGININKPGDREFGTTQPIGVELRFNKQKTGEAYWEKLFNYPQTGWSLTWINHRNTYLNHTIAINRYVNCVFLRRKFFEMYLKLSQGAMVATNIYERGSDKNAKYNNAIGQHLNFSEEFGLGITVYPSKKLAINIGATAIHYSNGAMAQPNDGLNLLMFNVGLSYLNQSRKDIVFSEPVKPDFDKRVKLNINPGVGFKQLNRNDEVKYQLFTFSLYADKMLTRVNAINLGIDVYVNGAEKKVASMYGSYAGKDYKRIGISAGHELFIGKVGLLTQVGYYVYSPIPSNSNFYQKFGFKYYLNELFFTTFTAKIYNMEISDEIAWGIGMRL